MLIPAASFPSVSNLTEVADLGDFTVAGNFAGDTIVVMMPQTRLSSFGTKWRFGLSLGSGGTLNAMTFGQRATTGNPFDHAASPAMVQCKFGGSNSITRASNGYFETDVCTFEPVGSAHFMWAFDIGSDLTATWVRNNAGAGIASYYRNAVQQATTADRASYTLNGTQRVFFIEKIFSA